MLLLSVNSPGSNFPIIKIIRWAVKEDPIKILSVFALNPKTLNRSLPRAIRCIFRKYQQDGFFALRPGPFYPWCSGTGVMWLLILTLHPLGTRIPTVRCVFFCDFTDSLGRSILVLREGGVSTLVIIWEHVSIARIVAANLLIPWLRQPLPSSIVAGASIIRLTLISDAGFIDTLWSPYFRYSQHEIISPCWS